MTNDVPKCRATDEFDRHPRCYSPVACASFGYCRQRNNNGLPDDETRKRWQAEDSQ